MRPQKAPSGKRFLVEHSIERRAREETYWVNEINGS